jgi:hypothetical protein
MAGLCRPREFEKRYDELKKAQAERLAKREAELENARLLSQMAKVQHLPYLPTQDGFVFWTDEIDRDTALHHRLRLAKKEEFKYMQRFHLLELLELPGPRNEIASFWGMITMTNRRTRGNPFSARYTSARGPRIPSELTRATRS